MGRIQVHHHTPRLYGKHLSSSFWSCIKGSQGTPELCDFGNLPLLEHDFDTTLGLNKEELEFFFTPCVQIQGEGWASPLLQASFRTCPQLKDLPPLFPSRPPKALGGTGKRSGMNAIW